MHHVYLIPGFFGFANFGELKYFAHVRGRLRWAAERRGLDVDIHYVPTLPTASLTRRAARLLEVIAATAGDDDGPIHLVGHSTGGIDARLMTSPGVSLPGTDIHPERYARRVRTVIAVASPHRGTPQAALFTSVMGQQLLRALSIATLHGIRLGSVPAPALIAIAGALPRVGRGSGPLRGILAQVYRQLLRDFDRERQRDLQAFFADAGADQALLPQLSPEGMDLFNAAVNRRPGTRYGSVVARGCPPSWRTAATLGLSPGRQASYGVYRALYGLAAATPAAGAPQLSAAQASALREAYGDVPAPGDNDAIVPARSQVYGDIVHATWADHHDVIGHFRAPDHDPPHVDWMTTGAEFGPPEFEALWFAIATYAFGAVPV